MSSPADWELRSYRPGDEAAIVALLSRVTGRPVSEAHWRWKLKTVPSPVENVWLGVQGETPVFHYAGIPTRFHLQGSERHAMLSVDTATAPELQRRGLLTTIGRSTYDRWREAGIAFVFGMPNERWGSRASALGWQRLLPMRWLLRPLRPAALLASRLGRAARSRPGLLDTLWSRYWSSRSPSDPAVSTRELTRAGPELDELWRRAAPGLVISPVRDAARVAWRYLATPSPGYRVVLAERHGVPAGYAAFRATDAPRGRYGTLAELFAPGDGGAARTLLQRTMDLLTEDGADRVLTLAVPGTPDEALLRRAGFLRREATFEVAFVPLDPGLPLDVLRDPGSWSLCGGDFDVV